MAKLLDVLFGDTATYAVLWLVVAFVVFMVFSAFAAMDGAHWAVYLWQ